MTLIQTLLTPKGVIQVSDRLLTYPDGRVYESTANKAVSWCGNITFGFTGMAFTKSDGKMPISKWICHALQDAANGDDGLAKLQAAGAKLMRTTDYADKRLTIMMAGVHARNDSLGIKGESFVCRITNFEHVSPQADTADSKFHIIAPDRAPLGGHQHTYSVAGGPIPIEVQQKNVEELVTTYERHGLNGTWRNMVGIQRRHSAAQERKPGQNRTIGMSSMVVYIPPVPAGVDTFMMTNLASPNMVENGAPQFSFVGESGFSIQRFGPHFVCGSVILTDIVAESGPI